MQSGGAGGILPHAIPSLRFRFSLPFLSFPSRSLPSAPPSTQAVFDFVDVQSGGGADGSIRPGAYSLATSYPRRVLAAGGGQTLGDAGITARQEALFLELK